jgi:phosphate transport system substrate-binding protein
VQPFPAPVYAKWADTYRKKPVIKVNYQGIGSSGGVKQITATPLISVLLMLPLMTNWLRKACSSSDRYRRRVLAINLPGVKSGELVLDGKTWVSTWAK